MKRILLIGVAVGLGLLANAAFAQSCLGINDLNRQHAEYQPERRLVLKYMDSKGTTYLYYVDRDGDWFKFMLAGSETVCFIESGTGFTIGVMGDNT